MHFENELGDIDIEEARACRIIAATEPCCLVAKGTTATCYTELYLETSMYVILGLGK